MAAICMCIKHEKSLRPGIVGFQNHKWVQEPGKNWCWENSGSRVKPPGVDWALVLTGPLLTSPLKSPVTVDTLFTCSSPISIFNFSSSSLVLNTAPRTYIIVASLCFQVLHLLKSKIGSSLAANFSGFSWCRPTHLLHHRLNLNFTWWWYKLFDLEWLLVFFH